VVLQPLDRVMQNDPRYRSQFRADFRIRRGHVLAWLHFLKANYPDYRWINISSERLDMLPDDDDVSSSFPSIIDELEGPAPDPAVLTDPPPNSQSMVPDINVTETEVNMLLAAISGRAPPPPGLPAPSIRSTSIDEAGGKERIFAMAFPTLYLTGRADFNSSRERKVDLSDYARHLMCYYDGRFGRYPR